MNSNPSGGNAWPHMLPPRPPQTQGSPNNDWNHNHPLRTRTNSWNRKRKAHGPAPYPIHASDHNKRPRTTTPTSHVFHPHPLGPRATAPAGAPPAFERARTEAPRPVLPAAPPPSATVVAASAPTLSLPIVAKAIAMPIPSPACPGGSRSQVPTPPPDMPAVKTWMVNTTIDGVAQTLQFVSFVDFSKLQTICATFQDAVGQLTAANTGLIAEKLVVKSELAKYVERLDVQMEEEKAVREGLASLEKEKIEWKERVQQLEQANGEMQVVKEADERHREEAAVRERDLQEEISRLKEALDERTGDVDRLRVQVVELRGNLDNLSNERTAQTAEIDSLRNQNTNLTHTLTLLRSQYALDTQALAPKCPANYVDVGEANRYRGRCDELITSMEQLKQEMERKNNEWQAKCHSIQRERKQFKLENVELKEKLKEYETKAAERGEGDSAEREDLAKKLSALQEENTALNVSLAKLRASYDAAKKKIDSLTSSCASLRESKTRWTQEVDALKSALATAKSDKARLAGLKAQLDTQVKELRAENKRVNDEMDELSARWDEVEKMKANVVRDIQGLERRQDESKRENARLRARLKEVEKDKGRLEGDVDRLCVEKERVGDELSRLKTQCASETRERLGLIARQGELEAQSKRLAEQEIALQSRLDALVSLSNTTEANSTSTTMDRTEVEGRLAQSEARFQSELKAVREDFALREERKERMIQERMMSMAWSMARMMFQSGSAGDVAPPAGSLTGGDVAQSLGMARDGRLN